MTVSDQRLTGSSGAKLLVGALVAAATMTMAGPLVASAPARDTTGPAAPAAARGCAHPRGSTVAQSERARLLLIGQVYYGCIKPRGRLEMLLSVDSTTQYDYSQCSDLYDYDCSTAEQVRVVGAFTALVREHTYDDSSCRYTGDVCHSGSDSQVYVWDLRGARLVRTYSTRYPVPSVLLLDARGNTVELAPGTAAQGSVLTLRHADGTDSQLDIGQIEPRSVSLRGETVSWVGNGVKRRSVIG